MLKIYLKLSNLIKDNLLKLIFSILLTFFDIDDFLKKYGYLRARNNSLIMSADNGFNVIISEPDKEDSDINIHLSESVLKLDYIKAKFLYSVLDNHLQKFDAKTLNSFYKNKRRTIN